MKFVVIGTLVLIALAVAFGDSDSKSDSSAAPDVEHVTAADVVDSDASRGLELTDEGQEISARIVEWSTRGASGDLAGACSELDETTADVARIHEIVSELGTLNVPQGNVRKLRRIGRTLDQHLAVVGRGCANLGF